MRLRQSCRKWVSEPRQSSGACPRAGPRSGGACRPCGSRRDAGSTRRSRAPELSVIVRSPIPENSVHRDHVRDARPEERAIVVGDAPRVRVRRTKRDERAVDRAHGAVDSLDERIFRKERSEVLRGPIDRLRRRSTARADRENRENRNGPHDEIVPSSGAAQHGHGVKHASLAVRQVRDWIAHAYERRRALRGRDG